MVQLYLYSKLLASIVLFIYGLRLLSYNLLEVFELPLFRLFRDSKGSSYKSMLKGFALGAPSLECHKLTSSVGGMVQAGLLSQRHALVVTSFGQIFSVFGLVLALLIPLDKGIVMMGFAIVPLLLARGKWEEVFRNLAFVLIGIGIISFAQALMYEGVLVIQQHHEIIRFLNNSVIVSVISGTIIGFLCLLIFEKDTILLVLFFKLGILFPHDQHVFLVALSIPIIGCSLGFWPLANKSNIYGKRFFKVLILSEVVLLAFFIPIMLRFPEIFSNPLVFIFLVISFRFIKYLAIISAHSFLSKIALKLFPQQGHRENFQLGVLGDS
ncbi:hypothetical protein OAT67_05275, partial [Bacteriovoracaceae bacterium]|nr:hypothetical protein [Bacteriovoracaceae bacterium]